MISFPSTDFAYFVADVLDCELSDDMFPVQSAPIFCFGRTVHRLESLSLRNPILCIQTKMDGVSCRPSRSAWIMTKAVAMRENTYGYEAIVIDENDFEGASDPLMIARKLMKDIGIAKVCPYHAARGILEDDGLLEICDKHGNSKTATLAANAVQNPCETPMDYIIPLGSGSRSDNDELRILLRSLERNAYNLGRVIIVSQCAPEWLRNVIVVPMGDELPHNKDGNIINKILTGIKTVGLTGEFVWSADDLAVVKPVDLASLPPIWNRNGRAHFAKEARKPKHRWHERMVRTFDLAEEIGVALECNYEAHAMQRLNANELLNAISGIDYESGLGYGIMTLFAMRTGRMGGEPQERWKTCHETEESAKAGFGTVPFVQYNDKAFLNGLRDRLFQTFPMKSRYEF